MNRDVRSPRQLENSASVELRYGPRKRAASQKMSRTNVKTVLNTIENERHARGALVAAFADELRAVIPERAPESTRTLAALAKAERGEIDEAAFAELLTDLRSLANQAA